MHTHVVKDEGSALKGMGENMDRGVGPWPKPTIDPDQSIERVARFPGFAGSTRA